MSRSVFVALVAIACLGCSDDLGECVPGEAERLVYDESGLPSYEGQAMVAITCGNGAFCHSSSASAGNRYGADLGFDFDLQLASTGSGAGNSEGLRSSVARVRDHAGAVFEEVDEKRMPPFGPSTIVVHADIPRYRGVDGERLPWIDSVEGIEIFRNWLSCNAPIVERTTERPAGVEPIGDIVPLLPTP